MTSTSTRSVLAGAVLTLGALVGPGCDFNLDDPNRIGADDVFTTRTGLIGATIGLQELYNVQALDNVVVVPAITTRELAANTTFTNLLDLEEGGSAIENTNSNTTGLFGQLNRVLGFAESILEGVEQTPTVEPALASGINGLAGFYRAVAIGTMAQNFDRVPLATSDDEDAIYSSNDEAFEEAARQLAEAEAALTARPPNAAFAATLPAGFDLLNSVRAYRARYELYAGNDQAAIDAANRVTPGATSEFVYTESAENPLFNVIAESGSSYIGRDNLGLASVQAGDARIDFYTAPLPGLSTNGLEADAVTGFIDDGEAAPFPVYLPGELSLIRAEALVNLGRLAEAVVQVNAVRTKTAAQDPFGVGAGLPPYSGPVTAEALRAEVFYNRATELYLQGLRLVDSRRLGGPGPGSGPFQRNRNFYPYPFQERIANPNTPEDPPV